MSRVSDVILVAFVTTTWFQSNHSMSFYRCKICKETGVSLSLSYTHTNTHTRTRTHTHTHTHTHFFSLSLSLSLTHTESLAHIYLLYNRRLGVICILQVCEFGVQISVKTRNCDTDFKGRQSLPLDGTGAL